MNKFKCLITYFGLCSGVNASYLSVYVGPRMSMDMTTISLRGKLNDTVRNIKSIITNNKNEGKFSGRFAPGLSIHTLIPLAFVSTGLCLDVGRAFRGNNLVTTNLPNHKYKINASAWSVGIYGSAGFNFALFRVMLLLGAHGQYMSKVNLESTGQQAYKEWQWTPMIGIAPQIRLGIIVLEVRYVQPLSINWFTQGSVSANNRVLFDRKGAGILSVAALIKA
ncbi:MAG: hypothetical protein H6845_00740 [Alphaproteobacteria bacterium]|nr:MAG: hypothetical protein H6845_00740 [Alphaproteobacteria bacterium]